MTKEVVETREMARSTSLKDVLADINSIIEGEMVEGLTVDAETPQSIFHEGQLEVWNCDDKDIAVISGAQGGKSFITPYWLLREIQRSQELVYTDAINNGEAKFLYVGPTLDLLRAQVLPSFRKLFEEELKLGEMRGSGSGKPVFHFSPEGAKRLTGHAVKIRVIFAYAADPSNLESMTAIAAVWDEAGQKENREESLEALERRLSIARGKGFGRILYTTTPYEFNWFYRRIYMNPMVKKINFPSWMNPSQSKESILAKRGTMPLWKWEMMYEGKFTRPAGSVYDTFDTHKHTCHPFQIPASWEVIQGVDFGPINTASVWAAQEPKTGIWYVFRTYHGGGLVADHVMKWNNEDAYYKFPDGHLTKKRKTSTTATGGAPSEDSWRDAFAETGYTIYRPAIRSVDVQIQRVKQAYETGKLVIFDDLTNLIDEILTLAYKVNDSGEILPEIDKDSDRVRHRLAALRYLVTLVSLDEVDSGDVNGSRFVNLSKLDKSNKDDEGEECVTVSFS